MVQEELIPVPNSDPRQPAYDAVFAFLKINRARTDDGYEAACQNARVWRAVEVALDAMNVPKVSPSDLYPLRDRRSCAHPGEQEHDHTMCQDVVAEDREQSEPDSRNAIRERALAVIDARLALADAIRKACLGPHSYVDHHDGNTWWCYFCGYTEEGSRVTRPSLAEGGADHG